MKLASDQEEIIFFLNFYQGSKIDKNATFDDDNFLDYCVIQNDLFF